MSRRARLRNQDGFIRELVWLVVGLAVLSVVILDGMAIFNAYRSAGDESANAASAALVEYAQSTSMQAGELAAKAYLNEKGLEFVDFSATRTDEGATRVTVTATADTDTYAFHYLGNIPPLKDWVERTAHPTRSGSAE